MGSHWLLSISVACSSLSIVYSIGLMDAVVLDLNQEGQYFFLEYGEGAK